MRIQAQFRAPCFFSLPGKRTLYRPCSSSSAWDPEPSPSMTAVKEPEMTGTGVVLSGRYWTEAGMQVKAAV